MDESTQIIGLLGATSLVGKSFLRLLSQSGVQVIAYSRKEISQVKERVEWQKLTSNILPDKKRIIATWVCLAPIWVLPDHFNLLESSGVKKVVVLSSTSRFTKANSSDCAEQIVANRLAEGERQLKSWADEKGIDWVILRPTMIYGFGEDKNISKIVHFICRWHFFPLLGEGRGLRQPIHAADVAMFCQAAIFSEAVWGRSYNISGGETLSYKEMVHRVFGALGKSPRFVCFPRRVFLLGVLFLNFFSRFKNLTVSMVDRMNDDLTFDCCDAKAEFGLTPRPFNLSKKDLPECCRESL